MVFWRLKFRCTIAFQRRGFNSIDSAGDTFDSAPMDAVNTPPNQAEPTPEEVAQRLLEEAMRQDPELKGAQIDELLRFVPGKRALFSGRLHRVPVVFRHYLDEGGMRQARNQWVEMNRVCAYLDKPPYRINHPLHLNEEQRILVVERVQGRPLLNHMRRQSAQERGQLTGEAVRWLRAYTEPTEEMSEARVNSWVARAADASARQPHDRLANLELQVLARMQILAGQISGKVWRMAICHGDFHPNNLLVAKDGLIGIDIGGSDRIPIYKDMARFLAHMARRDMLRSGRSRFGVDAAALEEFAVVFGLNGEEIGLFLPFMIGFEILFRVEGASTQAQRIELAERLTRGWLDDLG